MNFKYRISKTLLRFFFVLFGLSIIFQVKAQDINFEHLDTKDGLSQLSVMSIYQDQFGVMWFGTREGINRFDGFKITAFYPTKDKTTLPGNAIYSIVGDLDGNVYFGCDGKLVNYNNKTEKFSTLDVENIVNISHGLSSYWVATTNQIYKFSPSKKKISIYCNLNIKASIKSVFEASKNQLLIGTNKGLYLLIDKKSTIQLIPNIDITSIYKDKKNNIWISTLGSGLYKLNLKYRIIKNYTHITDNKFSLSSNEVRSICEDKTGVLWVGTFTGLNKYIEKTDGFLCFSHDISHPGSISHSSVFSLFCDAQGTIWVGTYYGGVNYFNPDINIFNFYYPIPNNPKTLNNAILSKMAEDDKGNLWVGTDGGGVNYLNRKTKEFGRVSLGKNEVLNINIKTLLYEKKHKKLFIGSHFGGLDILDIKTGNINNYSMQGLAGMHIIDNGVYSMTHDGDNVYIATRKQLYRFSLTSNSLSELPENIISSKGVWNNPIYIDSFHNLWSYPYNSNIIKRTNLLTNKTKIYKILNGSNNKIQLV